MGRVYSKLTLIVSVEVEDGIEEVEDVANAVPYLMDGGLMDSLNVTANGFKGKLALQVDDWDSEFLEVIS